MPGVDQLLEIGQSALMTSQLGLQVAGHNVANVNTPGYSRQQVNLEAAQPVTDGGNQVGTGVDAVHINRLYDQFLGVQINSAKADHGRWKGKSDALRRVEILFNEMNDEGLHRAMEDFWGAWNELANRPDGVAQREHLVSMAGLLASRFHDAYEGLSSARKGLNLQIQGLVSEINSLSQQIADLNGEIFLIEARGETPNDYYDKRDYLLQELSYRIGIESFKDTDGKLNILLSAGGKPLVSGLTAYQLSVESNSEGLYDVIWNDQNGATLNVTDLIGGAGKIGGILEARDVDLPDYLDRMNKLAENIIFEVNSLHSSGAGLELFAAGTSLTGSYSTSTDLSGLAFSAEVDFTKSFSIWVKDEATGGMTEYVLDLDGNIDGSSTIGDLASLINTTISDGSITASEAGGALRLTADSTHSFVFGQDQSNLIAALGLNTFFTGKDAYDIAVNQSISGEPSMIAAAQADPSTGEIAPGDNSNALLIEGLQNQPKMNNGTQTFGQYYSSLTGSAGIAIREAKSNEELQEGILEQLNQYRESVSGVSLDEEMIDLMKFQKAYEAAAKVVLTAQEMLDILMQLGTAG